VRGESRPSLGDVVSAASLIIGLLTAWLYVAGWTYAYDYFALFRIPLLMVDLPLEHYFVYGGSVPAYFPVFSIIVAVLFTAILWGLYKWSNYLGRFGTTAALVILVFIVFGLARWGGAAAARSEFQFQRDSDYPAYPRVRLAFGNKSDMQTVIGDVTTRDCGRLVASSRELFFLIRPVREVPGISLDTIVISSKQAEIFIITGEYSSCH
jgi:hypothetical protein